MWVVVGLAGAALALYGVTLHVVSAIQQIYSAIYVVGGFILMAISALLFTASEALATMNERFRFEAPDAYAEARKARYKNAKANMTMLAAIIAILAFFYFQYRS